MCLYKSMIDLYRNLINVKHQRFVCCHIHISLINLLSPSSLRKTNHHHHGPCHHEDPPVLHGGEGILVRREDEEECPQGIERQLQKKILIFWKISIKDDYLETVKEVSQQGNSPEPKSWKFWQKSLHLDWSSSLHDQGAPPF